MSKKRKEPFWKRLNPELRHVSEHIGKIFDNTTLKDISEVAVYAGLAYVGTKAFGNNVQGALFPIISLKCAQSDNEVAGAAGVAGLLFCGLAMMPDPLEPITSQIAQATGANAAVDKWFKDRNILEDEVLDKTSRTFFESCPSGYETIPYACIAPNVCLSKACVKIDWKKHISRVQEQASKGGVG